MTIFSLGHSLLLPQLPVKLLYEVLGSLVHVAVFVGVDPQGKRRVRYPELPDHGAPTEAGQSGGGLDGGLIVEHLQQDGLDGVHGGGVVVEGGGRVGAAEEVGVVAVLVGDVEAVVGGVAAAELVLAGGGGHVVGVGVVEHEVGDGFPGDLATFHHHVEVEH